MADHRGALRAVHFHHVLLRPEGHHGRDPEALVQYVDGGSEHNDELECRK